MRPLIPIIASLCLHLMAQAQAPYGWTQGGPVSPDGTPVQVALDPSQHMKNVGGSDGAGLCVFTSAELSGRVHNLPELDGLQAYMRSRPGGGYPTKFDSVIKAFCAEKGVPVPPYVQVEARDYAILSLATRTGRYPCVAVNSLPGYRGRIAHMVNLASADAGAGHNWAVQDNNFPGKWSHLTDAEFKKCYSGWAVIFLSPGMPPAPKE